MQHTAAKTKVFQTTEYKRFTNIDGNRPLNKKKIQRIINEIKNGNDILDEVPVLVQENKTSLHVLDGQHRIEIAKQLKRPVHYIVHKQNMSLHNVAKVNSNVEKWKDQDFINAYAKTGNKNYTQLQEFYKTYGIAVGICLGLLHYGSMTNDGGAYSEKERLAFEQGTFEVKKYKEAVQVAELCKSFSAYVSWNGRCFIIAICRILKADQCDFGVLLKKFSEDPSKLQHHTHWKKVITNLEEIYNKGNSKRRVIY
jgi:hypothetical protein